MYLRSILAFAVFFATMTATAQQETSPRAEPGQDVQKMREAPLDRPGESATRAGTAGETTAALTTDQMKSGTAESKSIRQSAIQAEEIESEAREEQARQATDFTASDFEGKEHALKEYEGKIVVLEWTNIGCPFVQRHHKARTMQKLYDQYKDQVVWLAVDSGKDASEKKEREHAEKFNLPYPILIDDDADIARKYAAKTTPHMIVIDASGKIAYDGAIDDDPSGEESDPRNHVAEALAALTKGNKPPVARTTPYGCSVKY